MKTLTRNTQMQTRASDRAVAPRRWLLPVIAALVLLVVAGGVWAILEATGSDDQAAATELVDTWIRGWNDQDEDAIRSVFTDDAVVDGGSVDAHVTDAMIGASTNAARVGDLTSTTDDDVYAFVMEFDWSGHRWSGAWEVELDGDLISRAALTQGYTQLDS